MAAIGGVIVEFRDEDTDALLWKSAMYSIPGEDAEIEWTDSVDVTRIYEVKGSKFEFNSPNPAGSFEGAISCPESKYKPIIYVKEV